MNVGNNRAADYTGTGVRFLGVAVELNADFVAFVNLDSAEIGEDNFGVG